MQFIMCEGSYFNKHIQIWDLSHFYSYENWYEYEIFGKSSFKTALFNRYYFYYLAARWYCQLQLEILT